MDRPASDGAGSAPYTDSMTHTTFESDAFAASPKTLELVDRANADLVQLSQPAYRRADGVDDAIGARVSATAKDTYERFSAAARTSIRDYPLATLVGAGLGALTIGYLAGRLPRR